MRRAIRNMRSDKATPPRFCDVIVEDNEVILEVKLDRNRVETIAWEDLQYQVHLAIEKATSK